MRQAEAFLFIERQEDDGDEPVINPDPGRLYFSLGRE
jgi:hypothetical protein